MVIVILGTVYGMYLNCSPFPHNPKRGRIYAVGQEASQSGLGSRPSCAISPPPNLGLITSTLLDSVSSLVKS